MPARRRNARRKPRQPRQPLTRRPPSRRHRLGVRAAWLVVALQVLLLLVFAFAPYRPPLIPVPALWALERRWQFHLLLAVLIGTAGALAFARYDWKGRSLFQRCLLLPIFFPQPVLGLALLLALTAVGITPTWKTAVFAHLVWIVPIVTLVISIRLYDYDVRQEEAAFDLGASRWQVFRDVTLPAIGPGIVSGGLFAFLLSWSNLPLSIFTTGADTTLPEWLFSRTATNYSPLVPAVAVIATLVSALVVALVAAAWLLLRRR